MAYCIVTGAAGFIGSHLAEALIREGHHVLGVDSFTPAYDRSMKLRNLEILRRTPKFKFTEKRIEHLTSEDFISEEAFVFHLAGQPGVRNSWGATFRWRPHGRLLGQPAAPSKDCRLFVQTMGSTSEPDTQARIVLLLLRLDQGLRLLGDGRLGVASVRCWM